MNLHAEKDLMVDAHQPRNGGIDDLVKVASFIGWHPPSSIWGNVTTDEAMSAFCRIVKIDKKRLLEIVVGPEEA
jgi:hypothetical protein